MSAVELRKNGLHLTGTALALDARRKSELSFVSHAHSDHIARHERVIATSTTLRFLTHRLGKISAPLPAPYERPFGLGPLVVELFPAGHILGSAQLRVTRADGVRIVYTGDFSLAPSLTAEPAPVLECDVLIIESTFGHPRYVFPDKTQVFEELESWLRDHLQRGVTPVLLGYPLGKSQETLKRLASRGFSLCAHASIHEITLLYRECGMDIPGVRRFDGEVREGEVLMFPPRLARSQAIARLWPRAVAVLTGWALDPGAARRYSADVAFPLSDHADFPSLLRYAKQSGADEVLTHHGFADELAVALRGEGLDARRVGVPQQLKLF